MTDKSEDSLDGLLSLFFSSPRYRSIAHRILIAIRDDRYGDHYTRSLSRDLGVPASSVADVLHRLEEAGLVCRAWKDDDPRYSGYTAQWVLSLLGGRRIGGYARFWRQFIAEDDALHPEPQNRASEMKGVRATPDRNGRRSRS